MNAGHKTKWEVVLQPNQGRFCNNLMTDVSPPFRETWTILTT